MTDTEHASDRRRSDLDEVVKAALAVGHTYAVTGAASGQSERTVRRRMSDSEFAAEVSARLNSAIRGTDREHPWVGEIRWFGCDHDR